MTQLDDVDLELLTSTPTRLRATAAALALVVSGRRPSLSEVARLSGVTRQALNKDHKPVAAFVSQLRSNWQPAPSSPHAKLIEQLSEARSDLKKQEAKRKQAEEQRDRALHHLQLAEASLQAERDRAVRREVVAFDRTRG